MKLSEIAQTKLEKLLTQYGITNYTIRDDGLVDVNGDVNIKGDFAKLPIKFAVVTGDFDCSLNSNLISLEGAPRKVGGNFSCRTCLNLISLEGASQEVGGDFDCAGCRDLISLKGAPQEISRDFDCSFCSKLTSLEGAPYKINKDFRCFSCDRLTSLKGAPSKIGRNVSFNYCSNLISLEGAPQEVGGDFDCSFCENLTSLDYLPKQIGKKLLISGILKVKNYLDIFNRKKQIKKIELGDDLKKLENIINKYLPKGDMLGCQDELIEAGLEKYAEI